YNLFYYPVEYHIRFLLPNIFRFLSPSFLLEINLTQKEDPKQHYISSSNYPVDQMIMAYGCHQKLHFFAKSEPFLLLFLNKNLLIQFLPIESKLCRIFQSQ